MPIIKIQTDQAIREETTSWLFETMTDLIVRELNKPKEYVQVLVEPNCSLAFAGDTQPSAFVELRAINLPDDKLRSLSAAISKALEDELGIPPNRVFINFFNIPGTHWGWNGGTFG